MVRPKVRSQKSEVKGQKKPLSQSDVTARIEMWSRHERAVAALETEKEQDQELIDAQARVDGLAAVHDAKIEAAQARADRIKEEIFAWLEKKTKSLTIESRHAIAELVVGTKLGNRDCDKKRLQALCKKKDVDFYDLIVVLLAEADKRLDKKEVDAICTREQQGSRTVTLKLK